VEYSPTVRGRRLIREIERLRHGSGLSMDAAAQRLGWSTSKLYRLENGRSRITTDDLADMLDLYGVRSPQREALIQLGRDARRRGWWTAFSDVFTGSYIAMEAEAASIRINAHLVPGIFQTPGYAHEMIRRTRPAIGAEDAERRVAARTARQDALASRPQPPQIHVILDEAVLHRQVGGPAVTCQQLAALAETTTWPNVTLQVIPFTAGANAGMDGHFVILAFPDPEDPPVAYVEGLMGDVYVEAAEEVDRFTLAWTHLVTQALHPAGSAAMIRTLGAAMTTAQDTILTRPWRKSSRSTGGNDCVEVAQAGTSCLIRDSKNPDGARLAVRPQTWAAFIRDIKHGAYRS
jgi:transcriptional regulator with XRE-family HTH domain